MRNTFVQTIGKLAEKDNRIVLLTGDLGYKLFDNFASNFPGRFINAGIAETNMMSVAAGMAKEGLKPFVYSIAPFVTIKCLEQIRNDLAYHNANVIIVGIGGGLCYGYDGPSHFATEDIAIFRPIPNMKIICPADPIEVSAAMEWIGKNDCGPIYLRLGKGDPIIHKAPVNFELGKGIVVCEGKDLVLFSTGNMLGTAMRVRELLETNSRISCKIISMPTVKPLDEDLIFKMSLEFEYIVTIEEHSIFGGLGSAVAESLMDSGSGSLLKRFALPDRVFDEVGDQEYLRTVAGLMPDNIYQQIIDSQFFSNARQGDIYGTDYE